MGRRWSADATDAVVRSLRALGGAGTPGDLLAITGIPRAELEAALDELLASGLGRVRVLDSGDLTYHLDATRPVELSPPRSPTHPALPAARGPEAGPRRHRRASVRQARRLAFDRRTLRLIRSREGVLALAELVELTGLPLAEAEQEMRRLAESFGGEPRASLDGHVVHAFPQLMTSVHGQFAIREPRPAWVRAEDPMDHAGTICRLATAGLVLTGGGSLALAGAVALLAASVGGVTPVLAVGVVGALMAALGMRLVLRNHRRFRFRQARSLRRYALGHVVGTALAGKGVVSLDRTVRWLEARAGRGRVSRSAVEVALRDLAREFDAPVTSQAGDLFFGFRNVKRQFLASHLVRRQLRLGRRVTGGATVFDSGDSPAAAAAREWEAWRSTAPPSRSNAPGAGPGALQSSPKSSRHLRPGPGPGRRTAP